jgi:uncharacterized membrane protein
MSLKAKALKLGFYRELRVLEKSYGVIAGLMLITSLYRVKNGQNPNIFNGKLLNKKENI